MKGIFSRLVVLFLLTACRPFLGGQTSPQASANPAQDYTFAIVRVFPHDTSAYTQSPAYRNGFLYEGTGLKAHPFLYPYICRTKIPTPFSHVKSSSPNSVRLHSRQVRVVAG